MAEFKFFCSQCGQHIQCDTSYSGRQINCPVCQQAIVVPQPQRADGAQPVPVKPQTLRKVLVIAASVVALAGLVIVVWYGYSKIRIHILSGHLPPGLVALWSGEGNGKDSISGNNATLTDITFAKGKVGQAFRFNGKTSCIKIPASSSLDIGRYDGFTIMAWIKPSNIQGLHPMIDWFDNNPGQDDDPVHLWICARPDETGVLRGNIPGGEGGSWLISQQGVLTSGVFQHIAMTYDKASGMSVLYVNGVMVAQNQLAPQIVVNAKGDLWFSKFFDNQGRAYPRMFSGLMDEIALYNRALSASEIQTVCAEQNHGEPLTLPTSSTGWRELMR